MKTYTIFTFFCLGLFFLPLKAQTHNWTGNGGDNNWFNTANWDAGTVPIETSTVSIVGNVSVTIAINAAQANTIDLIDGAVLTLENDLETGSIITVQPGSTFLFASGTLEGSGIQNFGLLKIEGNNLRTFNATSITNHSEFLVTNSNQTQVLNTTINNMNTGLIDIPSVGGFLQQGTSSILNNDGLLRKSPDGINPFGNFYLIMEINNRGTIEVQEDQIFLLLAGASTFTNFEEGRVTGDGTYDITTTFINQGRVLPGNIDAIGTMDITNNFSLNGGTIETDLAGTDTADYDSIVVFGSPIMDGTITPNLLFAAELGDEFTIVSWNQGGSSCSFPAQTTALFDGLEYTFDIACNTNDVTLTVSDISVLGISEQNAKSYDFYVHPNPVVNEATFVFSSEGITAEETTLVIYDVMGQQLLIMDGFTSESNTFQRGNLPAGIYFAQISAEGTILATTKLVLN